MTITPAQCRMARAGLRWRASELAKRSRVGVATINRFEAGRVEPMVLTREAIQKAFESAGVVFGENDGVQLHRREVPGKLD